MEHEGQEGPILHPNEDCKDTNHQLELEEQVMEQILPTDSYYDCNTSLWAANTVLVGHYSSIADVLPLIG